MLITMMNAIRMTTTAMEDDDFCDNYNDDANDYDFSNDDDNNDDYDNDENVYDYRNDDDYNNDEGDAYKSDDKYGNDFET